MYRIGQKKSKKIIGSAAFQRLVQGLKDRTKTIAVVESSCGGLIQASIMAVPGSSQVYFGGSIAYNTQRSLPLLFNDKALHERILQRPPPLPPNDDDAGSSGSSADDYIRSKEVWTAEVAKACCDALGVDYAIAEGGASGPTFRPKGMKTGFAVLALAENSPFDQLMPIEKPICVSLPIRQPPWLLTRSGYLSLPRQQQQ
jgi:nicotinamide mononucleotide (NMN) deamidase PncC